MPATMVSADKKLPPHRGEGYATDFSGYITLRHDGELTDDDVKEIRNRYKCEARIWGRHSKKMRGEKSLTVTCKAEHSANLTEAVKLAEHKIFKSAEAKIALTACGRRRTTPRNEQLAVPVVQPQPLAPHVLQRQHQMKTQQQMMAQQEQACMHYQLQAGCANGGWRVGQTSGAQQQQGCPQPYGWPGYQPVCPQHQPGWPQQHNLHMQQPCAQQSSPPQKKRGAQRPKATEPTSPQVPPAQVPPPAGSPPPPEPTARGKSCVDDSDSDASSSESELTDSKPAQLSKAVPAAKAAPQKDGEPPSPAEPRPGPESSDSDTEEDISRRHLIQYRDLPGPDQAAAEKDNDNSSKKMQCNATPAQDRQDPKQSKPATHVKPVEDKQPPWKDKKRPKQRVRLNSNAESWKQGNEWGHKRQRKARRSSCEQQRATRKKRKREVWYRYGRDRQSGESWGQGEKWWYQGRSWDQGDEDWGPPEQAWPDDHTHDWPRPPARGSPRAARLPQMLPAVNFLSFGRKAREVPPGIDTDNDRIVRQYLLDEFTIEDALIFDVDHWNIWWGRYNLDPWADDIQTQKTIANHKEWSILVNRVRPYIEAQLAQVRATVNIAFVCEYGRQASVAAADLFGDYLGTDPCRA